MLRQRPNLAPGGVLFPKCTELILRNLKINFLSIQLNLWKVKAEEIWIRHLAGGDIRPPGNVGWLLPGKAALRPVFKC